MSNRASFGRTVVLPLLCCCVTVLAVPRVALGDTIAHFGFELNTPPDLSNSAAYPPVAADSGANAFVSGAHSGSGTDWTTPVGNGSANSFSANVWMAGDYFQFTGSTLGFEDVALSWDQTRSATGAGVFDL